MSDHEPAGSSALTRLVELLRDAPRSGASAPLQRGLFRLRARLSAPRARRGPRSWALAFVLAALCATLTALVLSWQRPTPRATLRPVAVSRVEGGQLLQGGYLSESAGQGVRLFFDEGSQVALAPGGRGRLRVDGGVRLMLERGSVSLQITPTAEPRWAVESGPFLVTVKGTDFSVGWDPTSELFELSLRRGRVTVSGPVLGDDFVVRPGQKLSVSLPKAESVITEQRPPAASPSARDAASAEVSAAPARAETDSAREAGASAAPAPATSQPQRRQWRSALASGEWDRILSEAERGGLGATLEAASSDDLFALADAARYRRRSDVAQAALLAHRRRFPGSRAAEAIFLLGRVAELRAGGLREALARYDEYLARAPAGTYAAEALGRKMTLVKESGGAAGPIARDYLRRFPDGSYAGAARTLLSIGE